MKGTLNANAQAVLAVVKGTDNHPTASDIYETVREARPHIGLASVYRILHMLVEQRYVKETRYDDGICRYDAHMERHDHAICTECGTLIDILPGVSVPQYALDSAADAVDIRLISYELRLYGICAACSQKMRELAK